MGPAKTPIARPPNPGPWAKAPSKENPASSAAIIQLFHVFICSTFRALIDTAKKRTRHTKCNIFRTDLPEEGEWALHSH
jgi:hypothetical protein